MKKYEDLPLCFSRTYLLKYREKIDAPDRTPTERFACVRKKVLLVK